MDRETTRCEAEEDVDMIKLWCVVSILMAASPAMGLPPAMNAFGGVQLDPARRVLGLVQGNQALATLGNSVASAGDVNGDGFDDVVIGANGYDRGESDEGAAFV